MARLPEVGGDEGSWGKLLNDFLLESHTEGGLLKDGIVTTSHLKNDSVTAIKIAGGAVGPGNVSQYGQPNGFATLNSTGRLTNSQLPDYLTQESLDAAYSSEASEPTSPPVYVNVKDHGAVGDGLVDDKTAIQSAIDSSVVGATIFFPAGIYSLGSRLVFRGNRRYIGSGNAHGIGSVLKQADGANIDGPLVASEAWAENFEAVNAPLLIFNLKIDANSANNASSSTIGVALTTYWSILENVAIFNTSSHGLLLTDRTSNGSVVNNSASENKILHCRIHNIGGDGIHQESVNNISNQDGYCVDSLISNTAGNGIKFQRGSGWSFRRNHLYDIHGTSAIALENCFGTHISDNYMETSGSGAGWHVTCSIVALNGFGTHIVNNLIGASAVTGADSTRVLLDVAASVDADDAHAVISGNILRGSADVDDAEFRGLTLYNRSGGVLHASVYGNSISNVNTPHWVDPSVVLNPIGLT